MVPSDLKKYKDPLQKLILKIVPYQHLYFTLMLPLLRFSWTSQSIEHVLSTTANSPYTKDKKHAREELVRFFFNCKKFVDWHSFTLDLGSLTIIFSTQQLYSIIIFFYFSIRWWTINSCCSDFQPQFR